ncbi:MAG TPA: DUF3347 domain-containing protein [Saprospiraceae bacterium]|nr:DUF3347 domain-containing protein [Saprospiraceae bacterium]
MSLISKICIATTMMLSMFSCNAQIKNASTVNAKIYGNCGMCEKTIEKAGNASGVAKVDWDKDTKMATLTYDSSRTNQDEILKRIALAGYDSDQFIAPDDVYASLPECCQYERAKKIETPKVDAPEVDAKMEDHAIHQQDKIAHKPEVITQDVNELKSVFDTYFALKDALVKSDGSLASMQAKKMLVSMNKVNMKNLATEEHTVWMKVMKDLVLDTEHIEETQNADHQREHFTRLSDNVYQLLKVSKQETSTYYQHCPMYNDGEGANWLSKEKAVKNPYYGAQMLTCGKTIEEIK